jgi:hypothetical protein
MIETAALTHCERFQRAAAAWLRSRELMRTNHMLSALEEFAGFNYGFVYLLDVPFQRSAMPILKIGFSEHPMRRIRELIPFYGKGLRLRACFVGEPQAERDAHRRFAHLRVENECFMANPAIESYFAAMRTEMRERLRAIHLCSSECPLLIKGLDLPMLRAWLGR